MMTNAMVYCTPHSHAQTFQIIFPIRDRYWDLRSLRLFSRLSSLESMTFAGCSANCLSDESSLDVVDWRFLSTVMSLGFLCRLLLEHHVQPRLRVDVFRETVALQLLLKLVGLRSLADVQPRSAFVVVLADDVRRRVNSRQVGVKYRSWTHGAATACGWMLAWFYAQAHFILFENSTPFIYFASHCRRNTAIRQTIYVWLFIPNPCWSCALSAKRQRVNVWKQRLAFTRAEMQFHSKLHNAIWLQFKA